MTLVLVVDDDALMRYAVRAPASALGHQVVVEDCFRAALARLVWGDEEFGLAVLDQELPDGLGEDIAAHLAVLQPDAAVVLHTGNPPERQPFGVHHVVPAPGS